MGVVTVLAHRPELTLPLLSVYADAGAQLLVWYLDGLTSFLVAFAVAYGAFSLVGALFPRPLGARPRVWRVPALFIATATAFFLGLDGAVSAALRNILDAFSLPSGFFVALCAAGCVWLLGAVVHLWRAFCGPGGILRVARAAARLPLCRDAAVLAVLRRALADAGAVPGATLRIGAPGTPIFSCAWRRASIVVPENFGRRYSPAEQYAVLLHECVHLRRRDSLVLPCMAVLAAVLWFDPVTRRALRRMKTDMELFCDWAVVRLHGVSPELYAGLILDAVAPVGEERFAAAFSAGYRTVAGRLGAVLRDGSIPAPPRLSRRGAGLCLAALGAVVMMAVYCAGASPLPPAAPERIRGPNGEALIYEVRHGVFGSYGIAYAAGEE